MQPSESSEAPTQKPEQPVSTQAALNKAADQALDQLAEIAALSHSMTQTYFGQVKLTEQIATAEWQLTGRSLTIAAALMVCFGAGIILLWGSILVLMGYLVFQLSHSLVISAAVSLFLQVALLFWCWRSLGYVLSHVGFAKTWLQLQLLFFSPLSTPSSTSATQGEPQDADSTAT